MKSLDVREIAEGELNPDSLRKSEWVSCSNCGQLGKEQYLTLREFVRSRGRIADLPGRQGERRLVFAAILPRARPAGRDAHGRDPRLAAGRSGQAGDLLAADLDRLRPSRAFGLRRSRASLPGHGLVLPEISDHPGQAAERRLGPGKVRQRKPALVENHLGTGVAILAAFPATPDGRTCRSSPSSCPSCCGWSVTRHSPTWWFPQRSRPTAPRTSRSPAPGPAIAKVIDPLAQSTAIALERSASRLLGQFDQTSAKGYYRVEARGGRLEPPQAAVAAFAVNTAPEESDFQTVAEDQIREWLPTAQSASSRPRPGRTDVWIAGGRAGGLATLDSAGLRFDRRGVPAGDHEPPCRDRGAAANARPEAAQPDTWGLGRSDDRRRFLTWVCSKLAILIDDHDREDRAMSEATISPPDVRPIRA